MNNKTSESRRQRRTQIIFITLTCVVLSSMVEWVAGRSDVTDYEYVGKFNYDSTVGSYYGWAGTKYYIMADSTLIMEGTIKGDDVLRLTNYTLWFGHIVSINDERLLRTDEEAYAIERWIRIND